MFSLDNDLVSEKKKELMDRLENPRLYYSFLREDMSDNTMGARIVFNSHQKKKILQFDNPRTTCPVDAGIIPVKDACQSCRKCFSEVTLSN